MKTLHFPVPCNRWYNRVKKLHFASLRSIWWCQYRKVLISIRIFIWSKHSISSSKNDRYSIKCFMNDMMKNLVTEKGLHMGSWIYFRKHENIFALLLICKHRHSEICWHPSIPVGSKMIYILKGLRELHFDSKNGVAYSQHGHTLIRHWITPMDNDAI